MIFSQNPAFSHNHILSILLNRNDLNIWSIIKSLHHHKFLCWIRSTLKHSLIPKRFRDIRDYDCQFLNFDPLISIKSNQILFIFYFFRFISYDTLPMGANHPKITPNKSNSIFRTFPQYCEDVQVFNWFCCFFMSIFSEMLHFRKIALSNFEFAKPSRSLYVKNIMKLFKRLTFLWKI